MTVGTMPSTANQKMARAKSLLKRDETMRALEALFEGLALYDPSKLMGKARFETEVLILECVQDLNRQPSVRSLLEVLTKSSKATVMYTPGQEAKLKQTVGLLLKALQESEASKERNEAESKEARKATLQEKGINYLKSGDTPRGRAALRVLADEFGDEPGIYAMVGQLFLDANLHFEAVDFLELAIENFPKDPKPYAAASSCYAYLREYEKGEAVYLKAIKQFGKHTKTLTNLAKLYLEWNKKDKAFETAQAAVNADPNNAEAKAIYDKLS